MKRIGMASAVLAWIVMGCGGDDGGSSTPDAAGIDAPGMPDAMEIPDAVPSPDGPLMPRTLSETGLYTDVASGTLAPGVREFQPAGALWSDGAAKRRWVYLPAGKTIDTSDMDYWNLPVGTKLWKEFTRDGIRVETRLLYKVGPNDWYSMAYIWNDDETDAEAAPFGRINARGTEHDVPRPLDCLECHEGVPDRALGFSAIQLDHDLGGLTLADLVAEGLLSDPPAGAGVPYFPLPGDATAQAALRYMHGNCGGCHNPRTYVDEVSLLLRLEVGKLGTVESTPVYTSTVGKEPARTPPPGSTAIIQPGDPDTSALYLRMSSRGEIYSMPPLGTELVDTEAAAAVQAWITALGATGLLGTP